MSTTFETADGMTIMIGGLINRLRTLENGFSSKVCNKFLLGFPYDWAEYSTSCYGEDSSVQAGSVMATASEKSDSQSRSTTNYLEATSLDDVTVPKLRDLFSLGDLDDSFLMEKIYDDVWGMLGSGAEHDGELFVQAEKLVSARLPKAKLMRLKLRERNCHRMGRASTMRTSCLEEKL
ncbi:uncharacterized protein J3R85_001291 [Psidium guajava]|nr:uncharacterized protein J3R85_001291 [Psidium guajava]